MTYTEKLAFANAYTQKKVKKNFLSLPDINDLHDAHDEEEVIEMCDERIREFENQEDDDVTVPDDISDTTDLDLGILDDDDDDDTYIPNDYPY